MIFKIGNTAFDNCCVEPRISSQALLDVRGVPYGYVERWDLQIWLLNPTGSQSTMKTKIAECQDAFASNFKDVMLLQPDGSTRSQHVLLNAQTFGGVIVVQRPQFPDGKGAQHVTFRTANAAVQATIMVDSGTGYKEHFEEVTFSGGGPRFGHLEPLWGRPIKQLRKQNTIYKATQTGRREGIYGFPDIPAPIWPSALLEEPIVVKSGPRLIGNTYTDFLISWTYQFEDANRLVGSPTPWVVR